ncbi:MAG: VWA domain-containing protein [Bacteroidota bacterium]|nr:VWA domain-containing protein [Bacteroidota bacterium]
MIAWWQNIVFEWKWVLWFLSAVPPLAILMYYLGGRGRPALSLSSLQYLKGTTTPPIVKWRTVLYLFRFFTIVLLIVALARPQSRTTFKEKHGEGIDIMLVIDVSPSMDASDFRPTRMEAAKLQAGKFVEERPDDRIGVVIFSGEAFTVCPLTSDHNALKILISNIASNKGEFDMGTAIGMGLAKGVDRLKESKAKSKIVVLITDGENNKGTIQPLDAGRIAKTFNVRVYTIGMGATQGKVLTPTLTNPDGSYVQQYQDVDIDEGTLINIANTTGGKYFRASDDKNLERIYSEINQLEKSDYDKKGDEQRQEEFLPFLLLALFFVVLEFILRYTTFDSLT